MSRELLMLLLEAEGYEVEAAPSGDAAVAHAASCSPDAVLTDIQMPGLAGSALATALRAALGKATLLLAMSGSQPPPALLSGFDGFLLKPFTVSELRSAIERAAPRHEAGARAGEPGAPAPPTASDKVVRSSDSGPAALDEGVYAKMCDLMPVAQLGQMYALCVDDARKRIARMESLAAAEDDAEYRKEAHAVKGGSGMLGATELYALAAAAEQGGLPSHPAGPGTTSVTATLAQLSHACDRLERILQERTRE